MSARAASKLRRRLDALGAWIADACHVQDGQRFLVRTGRTSQRVMRPGTARAYAARLEDVRWGLVR